MERGIKMPGGGYDKSRVASTKYEKGGVTQGNKQKGVSGGEGYKSMRAGKHAAGTGNAYKPGRAGK